jgi:hypothetical protein
MANPNLYMLSCRLKETCFRYRQKTILGFLLLLFCFRPPNSQTDQDECDDNDKTVYQVYTVRQGKETTESAMEVEIRGPSLRALSGALPGLANKRVGTAKVTLGNAHSPAISPLLQPPEPPSVRRRGPLPKQKEGRPAQNEGPRLPMLGKQGVDVQLRKNVHKLWKTNRVEASKIVDRCIILDQLSRTDQVLTRFAPPIIFAFLPYTTSFLILYHSLICVMDKGGNRHVSTCVGGI